MSQGAETGERSHGAAYYAQTRDWTGYYNAMAGTPPRPLLLEALSRCEPTPQEFGEVAIDLACGEGRDTVELLRRSWSVIAIDAEPEAIERLRSRPDLTRPERLTTRLASFDRADLPRCRLLNAAYALPFCPPEHFDRLWERICEAIQPGGLFIGQFFGDRDSWATLPDRSHHRREQLEPMFLQFDLEHFEEEEREGADALGFAKHWHIFHIIARKRASRSVH